MGLVTRSNMQVKDIPGIWHCRYWFPSNTHPGEDVSEHYVCIEPTHEGFAIHSLPNKLDIYLQAHMNVDANLATGTWLENTSVQGEFKGMVYSGVFQVIIANDMREMIGSWVGVGSESSMPKIYSGRWEMAYAGQTTEELPVH